MATLSPEPSTSSTPASTAQTVAAPLADPVAVSPPALALAPPIQQQHASDPPSTDSVEPGPSSANNKPVRPPRAVQRPSTASRRTSASGTDSVGQTTTNTTGAAVPGGSVLPTEANASEGTTLVGGASGTDSTSAEMSLVEKVDDAAAKAALAADESATGTRAVETTTSPVATSAEEKRPSTVSHQTAVSDSTLPTPKAGAASTSSPTSASNKPANLASSPAATSPANAPTTSRPRTAQPTTQTQPKKRKGGFSLLACLPCFGSTGHEEDPPRQTAGPVKKPAHAVRVAEKEEEKPKPAPASDPVVPVEDPVKAEDEKSAPIAEEINPSAAAVDPPAEGTLAPAGADVATADDPLPTLAAPPQPTGPAAQRGVVLPPDETEGVTSGAVVPPGQSAASQVPHPPTPTPKARRRRAKQQQAARSGTEGIITSVPEPGAVGGGIVLAPRGAGHDETTSSEVSSDEDDDEEDEDDLDESEEDEEEEEDEEQNLIARGGVGIPIGEDGLPHPLLDELAEDMLGRKCLVLDLDETLVHSSFKMVHQADFVVPVEIENQFHNVYVIKRPGVDAFLKAMGEIYEVVVFTASLSKYADPVLDHLDIHRVVKHRLFRESCYNNKGNYVKDLSQLGRPISESIIIDNSPASYVFHPNNAVPISSWFNDPHDTELTDLIPFLADLGTVDDVRSVLDANLYPPTLISEGTTTTETDGITTALQQL
ncbi:hypothetical protein JCM10908_001134 [Rhodotorula pacifica]|uniref:putative phosphatase n=1 Tax=Rhodotorula pacifica TaxID=1495444 RepID=UPI00317F35D6